MACFTLRLTAQDSVDILLADRGLWNAIFTEYRSSIALNDCKTIVLLFDQTSASKLSKLVVSGIPEINCKRELILFALNFTERYKKAIEKRLMLATLKS